MTSDGLSDADPPAGFRALYDLSPHSSSVVVGGNQVVGPRGAPIASPGGGAVIDAEGRAAITAILAALRSHGLIA